MASCPELEPSGENVLQSDGSVLGLISCLCQLRVGEEEVEALSLTSSSDNRATH